MLKKKQILTVVSITVISLLIGTMFNVNFMVVGRLDINDNDDGSPWDRVWKAVSELQAKVDSLNATLLELQTTVETLEVKVETLESQSELPNPDYDSGWRNMPEGATLILTHNLDTTEVFVYVTGYTEHGLAAPFDGINQIAYGGFSPWGDGLWWFKLTNSTIRLYREGGDYYYEQVRVMIWKISEPPI